MTTLKTIFWVCLTLIFYTYIGYGILLYILVALKRLLRCSRHHAVKAIDDSNLPEVTLMICAYNEEKVVVDKMKNSFALDYPKDKLKHIWVTDGSNDATNDLLKHYPQVTVVFKPEREGKTAALNHGIDYVETPIVVFTDANTQLNKEAITEIVSKFQDPRVGCVSGEKRVFSRDNKGAASEEEGLYWKYESKLKKLDNELFSTMGAAGELFAIRTALYQKMPKDTLLDDFIISMKIVKDGMRIAYTDKAYAMEYGSADMNEESKRKRRISAGGIQSIIRLRSLLNPFRHGIVTFQYVSHRVLRWSLTPICLLALIPVNTILIFMDAGFIYTLIWILQIMFYAAAYGGYELNKRKKKNKWLYIPYYFLFMNMNVFSGINYLIHKKGLGTWEKARRE